MGRAELYPEQVIALVCREMKWDWHTYQDQPAWFPKVILSLLQNEAEESRKKNP